MEMPCRLGGCKKRNPFCTCWLWRFDGLSSRRVVWYENASPAQAASI
jgi:hypothetical protein